MREKLYQDFTEEFAQDRVEPSGAWDEGSGLLTTIAVRNGPQPKASAPRVLNKSKSVFQDDREVVVLM